MPTPTVPLSATPCDARCPATSLVMVEKKATPAGVATLSFCGHHYHTNEALLSLGGWRVVADLRTWKGPNQ